MFRLWSTLICFVAALAVCTPAHSGDTCIPTNPVPDACFADANSCLDSAQDWYEARGVICSAVGLFSPDRQQQCNSINETTYRGAQTECFSGLVDCWIRNECGW